MSFDEALARSRECYAAGQKAAQEAIADGDRTLLPLSLSRAQQASYALGVMHGVRSAEGSLVPDRVLAKALKVRIPVPLKPASMYGYEVGRKRP